jgi:hypothetical protein
MKLIVSPKKTKLYNLKPGSLFMTPDKKCLALKSEYRTNAGAIEATIVGSGEMFWGGTSDPMVQKNLMVHPVEVVGEVPDEKLTLDEINAEINLIENKESVDKCKHYDFAQGRHKCCHEKNPMSRCVGVCSLYEE